MRTALLFPLLVLSALSLMGCAKEPLTKERAQELIEASNEFQPQAISVRLTPDEIQKGIAAGYWSLNGIKRSDSSLMNLQIILLSPIGATFFRGAPTTSSPSMGINQRLGARVIEIIAINEDVNNPKEKIVEFTWTRRFENQVPELLELFKDQPPQQGKKRFRYGKAGWELAP
ncbi:MAG TPA: hypothetical protein VII25_03475 [Candidatus Acidoferrum sp.]